jgi:hypothetical protein
LSLLDQSAEENHSKNQSQQSVGLSGANLPIAADYHKNTEKH